MSQCWCGHESYQPFSPEYGTCDSCGTLRYLTTIKSIELVVKDDEVDFYGKTYWSNASVKENFDIYDRARKDLTERNLHWLNTILKYNPPPSSVLEVGCGHGSFVGLLNLAGYNACGLEMSPWVVDFAKENFNIPVSIGPIESTSLEAKSFDVIALMDVFEHLADPVSTIKKCLSLLKNDGFLILQTPQYQEDISYQKLVADKNRFLEMLIPKEHIYLFSQRSVTHFFSQLGVNNIYFQPPIFDVYDMFFLASRVPLQSMPTEQIESKLLGTPGGRMALAMLDLRKRELALVDELAASEADRFARWEQIVKLTEIINSKK